MRKTAPGKPFMFVGPTLAALQAQKPDEDIDRFLHDYELLPPATCGSVDTLMAGQSDAGSIIIVDGYIDTRLAVGHAELCRALDQKWQVWGLCDLGAIRAYELRGEGMRAYGEVSRYLEENVDCRDDEIVWSFAPDPPYTVYNEPLLHCRLALQHLRQTSELPPPVTGDILKELSAVWYKERSRDAFFRILNKYSSSLPAHALDRQLFRTLDFQIKLLDFERFLAESPWYEKYGE